MVRHYERDLEEGKALLDRVCTQENDLKWEVSDLKRQLAASQAQVMDLTSKLKESTLSEGIARLNAAIKFPPPGKTLVDEGDKHVLTDDELLMERNVALGYVDGVIADHEAERRRQEAAE